MAGVLAPDIEPWESFSGSDQQNEESGELLEDTNYGVVEGAFSMLKMKQISKKELR